MTAAEFVGLVNGFIFLAIFVVTVARAVRLRTTPSIEIAVFFGLIVVVQDADEVLGLLGLDDTFVGQKLALVLLPLVPFVLVRIVDHFTRQQAWIRIGSLAVTLGIMAACLPAPVPLPPALAVVIVVWFVVGGGYASLFFVRQAQLAPGVTSRRLAAAAVGSGLLALVLAVVAVALFAPDLAEFTEIVTQLLVAACGVAYYAAFATPTWLRRTWQEPAVRAFLAHSASLTRQPDEAVAVRRMAELTAQVMGTENALVGIASPDGRTLRWYGSVEGYESPSDMWVGGKAFTEEKVVFSRNPARDDPVNADAYRSAGTATIMAAPIRTGEQRFGVMTVYASRVPVFAYSDRDLITVLAEQAAAILQARTLLREAAEVRAREVATRAKEDFLSAAAHDLRTPLSSMVLRTELLQRRMQREGSPHLEAVEQVLTDAGRVAEFVEDLLDAARAEEGRLSQANEAVDLAALANDVIGERLRTDHEITVQGAPTWVIGDSKRLR